MVSGQPNNGNQLDAITPETDIVTLTIGGNDVDFNDFAIACVVDDCSVGSTAYQNVMFHINNQLEAPSLTLFEQLLDKNNNLKLYVIGYPYLTPQHVNTFSQICPIYLTNSESSAVYSVVETLNNKTSAIVNSISQNQLYTGRISFSAPTAGGNPFENHTLCDPYSSYFNYVNLGVNAYSFHPNDQGQAAYKQFVAGVVDNWKEPHRNQRWGFQFGQKSLEFIYEKKTNSNLEQTS